LAGPLISSAGPATWSSRMILSSETQCPGAEVRKTVQHTPTRTSGSRHAHAAELEKPQWYYLAPPVISKPQVADESQAVCAKLNSTLF
jgi:hypothetical protein